MDCVGDYVRLLGPDSTGGRQDSDFHIWRNFVTVSLQCTQEEVEETPRWCKDPKVGEDVEWYQVVKKVKQRESEKKRWEYVQAL